MEEKIKPISLIYYELQGYLKEAPKDGIIYDHGRIEERVNNTIDELVSLGYQTYEKFKITIIPQNNYSSKPTIISTNAVEYRSVLAGAISRLYQEFFSEKEPPLGITPSMIINQISNQEQKVIVTTTINELIETIDRNINKAQNENEKGFLKKLKNSLPSVKTCINIISLVLNIASEYNLKISELLRLLS